MKFIAVQRKDLKTFIHELYNDYIASFVVKDFCFAWLRMTVSFHMDSTPEEDQRMNWSKHCGNNSHNTKNKFKMSEYLLTMISFLKIINTYLNVIIFRRPTYLNWCKQSLKKEVKNWELIFLLTLKKIVKKNVLKMFHCKNNHCSH